jgi:hypothetical protein
MVAKSSERGAVLIMAAVALMALVAFSAIVVDYGILWAARGQAQTSADAGALAGAQSLGQGAPAAETSATASRVARETYVWAEQTAPGNVVVHPLPFNCPASAGGGTGCIRVDVMRGAPDDSNAATTNVLPVFFASMLGISDQGVRATATAQAASGDSVNCVKPWAVADKWLDTSGPSSWDQWDLWEPGAGDVYRMPLKPETNPTGFSLATDRGMQMALKAGTVGTWSAGWTQELDFGCLGSDCYREAIATCPSWIPTVGLWAGQECDDPTDADPPLGCVSAKTGMSQGPTSQGVTDLINLDYGAYWDNVNDRVVTTHLGKSPREVPIILFHTNDYVASGCTGTNCVVKVVNIFGFFVEGMCNDVDAQGRLEPTTYCDDPTKTVVGRLVAHAAQYRGGRGESSPGAGFLQIYRLVR